MLSDNGPQFESVVYEDMWKGVGTKPKYTTPYHPQTNLTERFNRTIVMQLLIFVDGHHTDCDSRLRELGFAINTVISKSTGKAPCDIMLGRKLEHPWQLDETQVKKPGASG